MARLKIEKHKTAEIILESALRNFMQKGFEGTSINDVADDAKINKSLIYHHFTNKENLWKAVKGRILESAIPNSAQTLDFKQTTLRDFLEVFVTFRFQLYATQPDLVRLMGWQRLESQGETLAGVTIKKFTEIDQEIISLQKAGQIRKDLKPNVISYLIMSMASNGFMDKAPFLELKKERDQYLKVIIESLNKILSPQT
jgi:AcrR family transcriptional regulator